MSVSKQYELTSVSGEDISKAVWEHATDAMAVSNREATVLAANRAYLELYGYSAEEVIGHNFAIIFPEELREWANEGYRRTFSDPAIAPAVESTIRRKDGTERMVEARYTFILRGDERVAMISVVRDITEQRQAEEALRDVEASYRSLVDGNIIGILRADMEHIVSANDAFLHMVGYTRGNLAAGKLSWQEMTPPEWTDADERGLEEMLARGATTPFEKELMHRDGRRVPILIGATLLTHTPLTWICFVLDLTERKRAEASERQARLEAERAVLDRDRLLSIVAHDLRNPLTSVMGNAQMVRRSLSGTRQTNPEQFERLKQQVQQIAVSAVQMNRMIEEILDFSKLQVGVPLQLSDQPMDLVELLRGVVEEYRKSSRHPDIELDSASLGVTGQWDPGRLQRVFSNLLDNAVKYSPNGSKVRVIIETSTQQEQGAEQGSVADKLDQAGKSAPEWVQVRIIDQGIGIPAVDLPHVFDWYRRASNASTWASGTGLGLAGARQIVEQYGGTIAIESTESRGSTVTVSLPLPLRGQVS